MVDVGASCEKVFDAVELAVVGGGEDLVVEVCLFAFLVWLLWLWDNVVVVVLSRRLMLVCIGTHREYQEDVAEFLPPDTHICRRCAAVHCPWQFGLHIPT